MGLHVVVGHGHALKDVDQGVPILVPSLVHISSIKTHFIFLLTIPILPAGFMGEMLVDFLQSQEQLSVLF
jgi:hypothetical protein